MISDVKNIDCMEGMATFPDRFFDLAIVDPPYGINVAKMAYTQAIGRKAIQKNGSGIIVKQRAYKHGDWDKTFPGDDYFTELRRVSKHQIIWGENHIPYDHPSGRIVWNKLNGENSFSDAEIACCSLQDKTTSIFFMWSGMIQGMYCGVDVRKALVQQGNKKLNEERIHPTQKPVALYKWLLTNYAKPGDKILDTHLGSGSHRIAAHDLGFDFWGFELDKEYFDASEERFQKHISQTVLPLYIQPTYEQGELL